MASRIPELEPASETSASGTSSRDGGVRAAGRDLRGLMVRIVLLLAFSGAGLFVLLLGGGSVKEQDPGGSAVRTVVAEPPPLPAGAAPVFDAEALRDQLEEIAEGHEGVYGVAVLEPVSGTKISLRGDEEFMTASIGKLPVLATLYRAGARGELDLEEEISVLPGDVQDYGNGEVLTFPVDYSLSLREGAYRLVKHSDNIAWAMLNRRLGEDKIRAELEDMGIKNSRYSDRLSGYVATPNDVLLLLEKISDPQFTSEKLSAEMLEAMTETTSEDRIPEKLPHDVRVAHKTGSYADNFGDAGVMFYRDGQGVEKRYDLVVLAKGAGEDQARDAIQSMSRAVYEASTGAKVNREWSRGKTTRLESGVDDWPASQLGLMENGERHDQNVEPAKPPLDEKSLPALWQPPPEEKSLSESRRNVAADSPFVFAPLDSPTTWEPVDSEEFVLIFPEETIDQEEEEETAAEQE